jgi:hypothetical protein
MSVAIEALTSGLFARISTQHIAPAYKQRRAYIRRPWPSPRPRKTRDGKRNDLVQLQRALRGSQDGHTVFCGDVLRAGPERRFGTVSRLFPSGSMFSRSRVHRQKDQISKRSHDLLQEVALWFMGFCGVKRHRYQLAAVLYGAHDCPMRRISPGVGASFSILSRRYPSRTPKSSAGRTSNRAKE